MGDRAEYLSVAGIKARGWTDSMIKRLLGAHDKLAPNPHYSKVGAPMRLYLLQRIEKIERTQPWRQALEKAAVRSLQSRANAARSREALLQAVRSLSVLVPKFGSSELTERAIAHYNVRGSSARQARMEEETDHIWRPATPDSEPLFLDRIKVNFLRHRWTDYEQRLQRVTGKIGAAEAKTAIRDAILCAIAEHYPDLAHECESQRRDFEEKYLDYAWQSRTDRLTAADRLSMEKAAGKEC